MTRFALLFVAASMFFSTGCATLIASRTETLSVISDPEGAEVRVNGNHFGRTPTTVAIDRVHPGTVEVTKPGYQTNTCHPRMSPKPGYIIADVLLCAGLFPVGCLSFIDAAGAWNELDNSTCNMNMQPSLASMPQPAPVAVPVPTAPAAPAYQVPAGYQLVPVQQPVPTPPPGYQLVPTAQR